MKNAFVIVLANVLLLVACNNETKTDANRTDSSAMKTVDSVKEVVDSTKQTMDTAALRK